MTPILDPPPTGKPHDWSLRRIQQLKAAPPITHPDSWDNPSVKETCERDQDFRGTCVGQSGAHITDTLYIMLTGDHPTAEDKAHFVKDIVDTLGTTHDVLYPQSVSAESIYQRSRTIGNVHYPSGSEIRFAARALQAMGYNLESQWHTDKKGTMVWDFAPRKTPDGGMSAEEADAFAKLHLADGYAMLGEPGGNSSWDEVCQAIFEKGHVWAAIPVYENYTQMQGGDGEFPDPRGEIVGYHALMFYGYTPDKIKLLHSWGSWCGRYGSISKNYFNYSLDQSVYMVILDSSDTLIARQSYSSLTITVIDKVTKEGLPADIYVDLTLIGKSPQKIATVPGKSYYVTVSMEGYVDQKRQCDDSSVLFELERIPKGTGFFQRLIDWLTALINKLRGK